MYKSFSEQLGEARAMVYCNCIIIFSVCLQLIELKIVYLIAGRVILGVVIGIMSSILPLYLNSISPLAISGKICSLNQIMICLGVICAYLMGFLVTESE
jgi:MFS family permease